MNTRNITAYQKGNYNPMTGRHEGINMFKEYAIFCMSRRSYKLGRKGLTRSVHHIQKVEIKDRAYKSKRKARNARSKRKGKTS